MLPLKWENMSRCSTKLIHVCKKLPLAGRANIFSKYIIYIYLNFGRGFYGSFYFQKLQLFVAEKFWTNFCCIVLLYLWAPKVSQIFKILSQTGDINNFVLRGVFFSRYVQLKSFFSDEKTSAMKTETQFSREAIEINVAKY